MMVRFHQGLSDRSVYFRYFSMINLSHRVAHERLARNCFIDYDCQMALVAERKDPVTGDREILGVGRMIKMHGTHDAEAAFLVADRWQGRGLGTELLRRIVQVARDERLSQVVAYMLPDNREMQHVFTKMGASLRYDAEAGVTRAELTL
jgi:acetyltransferase